MMFFRFHLTTIVVRSNLQVRRTIQTTLLLLASLGASSQTIVTINDLRMRHFQLKDGLPTQAAERIMQDRLGHIWIGTYDGLLRYDGYQFRLVMGGKIGALMEDDQGYIWVGTEQDLIRYDPRTQRQQSFYYQERSTQPENRYDIISLVQDKTGAICVGTAFNCLVRLLPAGPDSFTVHRYPCTYDPNLRVPDRLSDTLPGNWVWSQITAENGSTWLGTGASLTELVIPDTSKPQLVKFRYVLPPFEPYKPPDYFGPSDISKASNGNLWVVARHHQENGPKNMGVILQLDPETRTFTEYTNTQDSLLYYRYLHQDRDGNLWNGPADHGLQFIRKNDILTIDANHKHISKFKRYPFAQHGDVTIGGNNIQGFLEDRDGTLWVLSNYMGIYQIPRTINQFRHHELPVYRRNGNNAVSTVLWEGSKSIWIATWRNGLMRYDKEKGDYQHYFDASPGGHPRHVTDLYRDSRGDLWACTEFGALHRYEKDEDHFRQQHLPLRTGEPDTSPPDASDFLTGISEDDQGNFWIASNGLGLVKYHLASGRSEQFLPDERKDHWILDNSVMCTEIDKQGRIWVGSPYWGLYCVQWDDDLGDYHFSRMLTDFPFLNDLQIGRSGHLWIGTLSHGLLLFDPDGHHLIRQFSTQDASLPIDNIWDIAEDPDGLLWLTSPTGIVRFDTHTFSWQYFGPSYGFQMSQRLAGRSDFNEDHQLVFAGEGGIYTADPRQLSQQWQAPPTVLTDLWINNQLQGANADSASHIDTSVTYLTDLDLRHDQNNLALSYAGLNFDSPDAVTYSYLLQNYHDDWQHVGSERTLRLTGLRPGRYLLRVRSWMGQAHSERQLMIRIRAPWWWNGWSKLAYATALFFVVLAFARVRTRLRKERLDKEKMKELNTLRSKFFANISHEFRTPLTLIKGPIADRLAVEEDPMERDRLQAMDIQADRMLKLINELLDLSRLDVGKFEILPRPGDLTQFLAVQGAAFQSLARHLGVELTLLLPQEKIIVLFDPDSLEKIVTNLLSNAIKFSPQGGEIQLRAKYDRQSEELTLQVNNKGSLIPDTELAYIFDEFYQASNAHRQGSGVGLSLTKQLVSLMGGTIHASSEVEEGTTFRLMLPLGLTDDPPVIWDTPGLLPLPGTDRSSDEPRSAERVEKPQILLVEDSPEVRAYLRSILETSYVVWEAHDGNHGLKQAFAHLPDLIISDVMMPDMDGVEFCRQLKRDPLTEHIPTILLTAKADLESRLEGLESGAEDYLAKPFNRQELLLRVRNLLALRDKLKERWRVHLSLNDDTLAIKSADERFLRKALDTVQARLSDPTFDTASFAQAMNLSRSHLHRKLTSIAGQTPTEFVRNLRLQQAAVLLQAKHDNVSQIAFAVGFNNLSYFTRCFREKYGIVPSAYAAIADT